MRLIPIGCAALLALAACDDTVQVDTSSQPMRTGTGAAESACLAAVNRNYGSDVASIISSDSSEADTEVMVSTQGESFRCLASNDGTVEDLAQAG
jgi:hypothetical protein